MNSWQLVPRKLTYPLKNNGWKIKFPFEMVPLLGALVNFRRVKSWKFFNPQGTTIIRAKPRMPITLLRCGGVQIVTSLLLFKQIICRISATRNDSILKSMCLSLEFRSCSGFPIVSDKFQITLSGKVVDRKFKAFFEAAMRTLGKMNFHFSSALEKIGNFQPNKKSASFNASPLPSPDNEHVKAILLYANSRALLPKSCSTNGACQRWK